MPNWVKTIVKTKPDILTDIMKKYSEKGKLTFDKVIPMPKDLEVDKGSAGQYGLIYLYLDTNDYKIKSEINKVYKSLNIFNKDIERDPVYKRIISGTKSYKESDDYNKCVNLAKKYISNYKKYGYCTWYEWSCENWGTKWDLTDFDRNKDTMIFLTAWDFAEKIMLELSKKYPKTIFECKYADEGIIENSAILSIKNGNILDARYCLLENEREDIWDTYLDDSELEIDNDEELEVDI